METEKLQLSNVHPDDPGMRFYIDGSSKSVYISPNDMSLIYAIRNLPVSTRLAIMGLSTDQLIEHINGKKKMHTDHLLSLLQDRRWRYKETGDKVIWDDIEIPGPVPKHQLLIKKLKSKNEFSEDQLHDWIDYFEATGSDFYIKE